MTHYKKIAVAVALSCSAQAWASQYPNIYFFGDSLTDSGAYTNLVGPAVNRFTNNPGTVWADNLGARYALPVTSGLAWTTGPFFFGFVATGGNNYAIGGARVATLPGVFGASSSIAMVITPIVTQVTTHLGQNAGAANPNALYAYWGGANDVFYQVGSVGAGLPVGAATTNILTAAADEVAQIARLRNAGARNLVVIALPDMGINPFATSSGPAGAALLTGLSGAYNSALQQGLLAAGISDIAYLDPRGLIADIMSRPADYGFTSTTVPACGAAASLGCGPAGQIPGSASFFFADGVHPTTATHKIISEWVYGSIEAPSRFAALAALPVGRLGAQWRSIDDRFRNHETASKEGGQGFFATVDYAPTKIDATNGNPGISGHGSSITLGVDRAWGPVIGGVAFGAADNSFDLGDSTGTIKYKETVLSVFGSSRYDAGYTDAVLSYANFDFDTTRNIALGALNASNSGNTGAKQWGLKLGGGYNFATGNLVHGPVAALSWEKVKVDGFTESGGPTAMTFGSQSRKSLRHRLGWQAVWQAQTASALLSPYLRVTHEKEYKDNQGTMSAGMAGSPFSFSVPSAGTKDAYGLIAFGTAMKFTGLSAHVGVTSTFGQSGARNSSIAFGISAPF